ncbi:MAG TPA: RNA-binding protein [Hyphomicrobiales bacterium]|nr:RNA-binding protein [Hyphomicrobiales bacterium]
MYLADHRDEFQQGLEAIEVRPLRRPADVIGNAIKVARIATGEEEEDMPPDDGKDKAAQEMGRKGAKARADKLSPERRAEIARKAAAKRWKRT